MHVSPTTLTWRCRVPLMPMFLGLLMFGGIAGFLGWMGYTNDQGLILNGIIEFSARSASHFYSVIAGLSALFAAVALLIIVMSWMRGIPDIVVTDETVSFPVGFPVKRAFHLPLKEITGISRNEVSGQRLLVLHTARKQHHIALNWLESKEAGKSLEEELIRRTS